jgi:DNA-3-methyladenine glycosylase
VKRKSSIENRKSKIPLPMLSLLPPSFFERDVVLVARELLGMRLVRMLDGARLGGTIVEAEAYRGEEDLACHARAGRTPRTEVMYGPPGRAYVYFTYGMHWMMNCVCGPAGQPSAVLLRAILPTEGLERISKNRLGRPQADWTNGPGKLTQALGIDGSFNGVDLCANQQALWMERGEQVPDHQILVGPRVGIDRIPEPWLSVPWRFRVV